MTKFTIPRAADGRQQVSSQLIADPAAAFKFLDFIFGDLTDGYMEFRYFTVGDPPQVTDQPSFFPLPYKQEQVANEVLNRVPTRMITVGIAPRARKPRKSTEAGKASDVQSVTSVWADIDFKSVKGGAIETLRRINSLPLRPSILVNSGFGYHIYYVFNKVLRHKDLLAWDEVIKSLRDVLGSDSTIDICRPMRLPGTINHKDLGNRVPCVICEEDSCWTRYDLIELKEALNETLMIVGSNAYERKQETDRLFIIGNDDHISPYSLDELRQMGVTEDCLKAIEWGRWTVRTGKDKGDTDNRSARDYMIFNTLLEKGLEGEEVKAIFRAYPQGCGSKWAEPRHGESYLERTLKSAMAHQKEKSFGSSTSSRGNSADVLSDVPQDYFHAVDDSLWLWKYDNKTADKPPQLVPVCDAFLRIAEVQENMDTGQISLVIEYTYRHVTRRTTILRSQMADASKLISALSGEGLPVHTLNSKSVLAYLFAYEKVFIDQIPYKKTTGRFGRGRADGPFFLPGLKSEVVFAPAGAGDNALYRAYASRQGSLKNWVESMSMVNTDRMVIPQAAILAAFVPPLQRKLQIPNFILDIYGTSSTGKSTVLKMAASVYGQPLDPESVIHQWINTKVAVEQIAYMCSELPVFLDDAQHASDDLKRGLIYMIANGKGKARGAKAGGIRETPTWYTVALSTSESPLHESSPHEGARGRLLPVGGLVSPFPPGFASFVQSLERAIAQCHGHAGERLIRHLNGWSATDWSRWQQRYIAIRHDLIRKSSSDIVGRVAGYIAAIQVAGEITCPLIGLPFAPEDVSKWLMVHLEEHQSDHNQVQQVLRALADHYVSNKAFFAGDGDYDVEKGRQLLGASHAYEFVGFLRSTFDEICMKRKWNSTAILIKLRSEKALVTTEPKRHDKKVTVNGNSIRMICVRWTKLLPDDEVP